MRDSFRHCRCSDHLIEILAAMIRANTEVPEGHPILAQLERALGKKLPTCPGTRVAPINWTALQKSAETIIWREITDAIEQNRSPQDAEVILTEIGASGAISKASELIVGSLERLIATFEADPGPVAEGILQH